MSLIYSGLDRLNIKRFESEDYQDWRKKMLFQFDLLDAMPLIEDPPELHKQKLWATREKQVRYLLRMYLHETHCHYFMHEVTKAMRTSYEVMQLLDQDYIVDSDEHVYAIMTKPCKSI